MSRVRTVWKPVVILSIGVPIVGGCADPYSAHESPPAIEVFTESFYFTYEPSHEVVEADLPFVLHNESTDIVQFERCAVRLERRVQEAWIMIWAPFCPAIESPPVDVAPGTAMSYTLSLKQRLGTDFSNEWVAPVEGTYRVLVPVLAGDQVLHLASEPFELEP